MISINEILGFSKLIPLTSNTFDQESLHKKRSFLLRISSVNVTKFTVS